MDGHANLTVWERSKCLLEFGGSFRVGIYVYHSVHADDMGFYPGIKHQRILSFNFQA